jgi:hypothetical protein
MSKRESNGWYTNIRKAVIEKQSLTVVLESFTVNDWDEFIKMLIEEVESFNIPIISFDTPIVYFVTIFRALNSTIRSQIGNAIESSIKLLLEEDRLDSNMEKNAKNAFFIAYAVPINIQDRYLLESIAFKQSIGFKLRTKAALIIASQDDVPDIDWWQKLVQTDDETTLAPMAVDALAEKSTLLAVKFLDELEKPSVDKIDNFRPAIRRLLQKILSNGENSEFRLGTFPYWSKECIVNLVRESKFKQLDKDWILDNQEDYLEYEMTKCEPKKTGLPPKNYPNSIEKDKIAESICSLLSRDEVCRIFIVGEKNKFGVDCTFRATSIGYRYSQGSNSNEFYQVIFIDSYLETREQIFRKIGDCLDDELIKSDYEYNNTSFVIKAFREICEQNQQKILLIIDDFHAKLPEEKNKIGQFILDIQEYSKILITIKNNNEQENLQVDNTLNKSLNSNSETIFLCPLTRNVAVAQALELVRMRELEQKQSFEPESMMTQELDRENIESIADCYLENPIAMSLALSTGSNLVICPLPPEPQEDRDPVWYSFNESIKLLSDLSIELLLLVSIFFKSKIFHNPSLNQEAIEYILSTEFDEIQIAEAIELLKKRGLISLSYTLNDLPCIIVPDSICDYIIKYRELQVSGKKIYEDKIFSKLTEYYIKFAEDNGGSDWSNRSNFEKLELEWYNILAVLEWNERRGNFDTIKKIWLEVNRFADLCGHWGDRKKWLEILINHYRHDRDSNTYARCLSSKGWTLTMSGLEFYPEAQKILEEAWNLDNVKLKTRCYLAHNMTVLYYRQKDCDKAKNKIRDQEELYKNIESEFKNGNPDGLTEDDLQRYLINYVRDKAKIKFIEENWADTYTDYSSCLEMCKKINWERMTSYCYYMLAQTLLKQIENTLNSTFKEEKLEEILNHISKGVKIAKENRNGRRLAYFKKSYANFQKQKGNSQKYEYWDREATNDFTRLISGVILD